MTTRKLAAVCAALIAVTSWGLPTLALDIGPSIAAAATVDCSDPAWDGTLFCRGSGGGTLTYESPIADSTYGGAFSARMLVTHGGNKWDPSTDLRCIDGTEPYYYVAPGSPGSNNWLFSFRGGGSCYADGAITSDSDCSLRYTTEKEEMTSDSSAPGVNIRTRSFGGILISNAADNAMFSSYNSIRPHKCGFDRYMGRMSTPALVDGVDPGVPIVPVFVRQQGNLIVKQVLNDLATGVTFNDCSDGRPCSPTTLPQLCTTGVPEKIVFAGHSGGSHGLIHTVDDLVQHLKSLGCNELDGDTFHLVIDAHFIPMVENECRYNGSCGCAEQDIFCHTANGANSTLSWDEDLFESGTGSPIQESYDWTNAQMDASCLASHPGNPAPCADRFHVLANHVATPFFVRESLQDANPEHCAGGDHSVLWANDPEPRNGWNVTNWDKDTVPQIMCGNASDYSTRVVDAALDIVDNAKYGRGCEFGLTAERRFFLPDCTNHEGVFSPAVFTTEIDGYTHYDALADFVDRGTGADIFSPASGPSICP